MSQPKKLADPKLFIARKRKKYKFAHFSGWPNCFIQDSNDPKKLSKELTTYFQNHVRKGRTLTQENQKDCPYGGVPLVLELAAGTAEFSLELAKLHLNMNFVAIDIKSDRLYTSAKKAQEENIGNIAFLRMHLNQVGELFCTDSVHEIWLTFPDPHPKKRSAKHRLTGQQFLRQYRNILKKSGELKFKTDNLELFQWSLEQFVADKWKIQELSFDLHESDLSEEYKIKTAYERKFTTQGLPINFVALTIR